MNAIQVSDWLVVLGAAGIWLGLQIVANAGLPRQLKKGPQPTAEPGSARAFGLFWIDQYSYIGLVLAIGGLIGVSMGIAA